MLAGAFGAEPSPATAGGSASAEAEPFEALEYDSFGPYRIQSVLGEGGMGTVYLAEQTRPLQRQVALKVVKIGLSSSQILSRFNYERQALALMEHPNIARVYDAGASEKGRPYFAMEYVDGPPITHYCDQNCLSVRERLELFLPVCLAVQHAHRKGVIHRDIKPSNVMVAQADGRPVPKVIDFGIARATEQSVGAALTTQLGQFIGTPEYMSPEQADLMTSDVDTSADVYSLGILLYELLAGVGPRDVERLRKANPADLFRMIREEEAIPMAARIAAMGQAAGHVAEVRRTDPATLRHLLSGDLNWVVMKALEKDRRLRYQAASELAADIRRHLDDQPVWASPPGTMYRARKFVRRNKGYVAAGSAVLAALVAGIVATSWQAAVARRERAQAVAARTLAEARLNDVHALADSMLFEINEDVKDLAGGTKAREALVRLGQQYLNREAAGAESDPRRREELAEAFLKMGDLQGAPGRSNLRDVAGARQTYARSAAMLESEVASRPHHPSVRHLLTLAYVRQAQLEESLSPAKAFGSVAYTFTSSWAGIDEIPSAAEPLLERAEKSADVYAAQWSADPQGLRDRAEVLQAKEQFAEAVELRQRILAASPNDPLLRWELAHAELAFGASLVFRNRLQSLEWLQKGAAACEALQKEDPANVQYQRDRAVALGTMTRVLLNLGRLPQAEDSARQSVSILEQLAASDPLNASFRLDLTAARVALSNAYYDNGNTAGALENVAVAAAIQQEQAARYPNNPDFPRQAAFNYRNAGSFKSYSNDFKGALEQYRKAETIDRKLATRYPGHFEVSEALRQDLDSIGAAYLGLDDATSALRAYRDAFEIAKRASTVPAPGRPSNESLVSLAMAHQGLSAALKAMSRWGDAVAEQRAAVAIWERRVAGNPKHQGLQRALSRAQEELSKFYEGQGDYAAAVAAAGKASRFPETDFAAHPKDESALTELRNALESLRVEYTHVADYDRAIAAARQAVEVTKSTGLISRGSATRDLGETLLRSGRRTEGLATLRDAVSILDDSYPINVPAIERAKSPFVRNEMVLCYLSIASQFSAARREDESAALLNRLLSLIRGLVRENPGNKAYSNTLIRAYRAAAQTALGLGDAARSLDFERKALKLQSAPVSVMDAYARGSALARTGSLQFRLGSPDAARATWREALGLFQQTARESERRWSADPRNLTALDRLRLAESAATFTLEELGDLPQALHLAEASYTRVAAWFKPGRGAVDDRNRLQESRAVAAQAIWLAAGERGDYSPLFESGAATSERVAAALADGWKDRADLLEGFCGPPAARLQAAGKALELARRFAAADPLPTGRIRLARSLISQGDAFRAAARCSKGAESASDWQSQHNSYSEALEILTSLNQSRQLNAEGNAALISVTNYLAEEPARQP